MSTVLRIHPSKVMVRVVSSAENCTLTQFQFYADEIVIDEDAASPKYVWWIQDLNLQESDRSILLSTSSEINDSIINAAQMLLSQQNRHLEGFQDTALGRRLRFSTVEQKGVQILHLGEEHRVRGSILQVVRPYFVKAQCV